MTPSPPPSSTPPSAPPLTFAGNPLDRASNQRGDIAWLAAQRAHPGGRYLLFRGLDVRVTGDDAAPRLAWSDAEAAAAVGGEEPVLLGLLDRVPHFAVAIPAEDAEAAGDGASFAEARAVAPLLPPSEAGMLAQSRSLLDWHARHRFCARCGEPTVPRDGGTRRECTSCRSRHYPRVDPSIIVLVEHGDRCLLARRPASPGNWHSCLAGFVEPGESIEEAVAREVLEETAVHIEDVRYHSSQPWPFPATLMIGCHARATSERITVDGVEISSARWCTRAEVREALAGASTTLTVPQPLAIAHHLIAAWAAAGD